MVPTSNYNSAKTGRTNNDWNTIKTLMPYLWPAKDWNIKTRVIAALGCLALAKIATVMVPVFYKDAVDLISQDQNFVISALFGVLVAYAIARIAQQGFAELREFFFARVGQRAIRKVALKTFRHLHSLSLRFHLDRQTGGLSRAIERGIKGIEFLLNFMLFNILPTLAEIALVCAILWVVFDFWYAFVVFITVGIWRSAENYKGSIIWILATFLFLSYRVFSLRLIFFG